MATRSIIAMKTNEGYKSIYCHWDGYVEGVGVTLLNNYTTKESVEDLLKLGDMSSLEDTLQECETYRNRGEKNVDARISKDRKALYKRGDCCWAEYVYIFENNKWLVRDYYEHKRPITIAKMLIKEAEDRAKEEQNAPRLLF